MRSGRKERIALFVSIAVLVYVVTTYIVFVATHGQICNQSIDAENLECGQRDFSSFAFLFGVRLLDAYNGLIQGVAAVAVVWFTYWLMRIAKEQAEISSKQVALMKQQAEIMDATLKETCTAANAARDTAEATKVQIQLASDAHKLNSRAWITYKHADPRPRHEVGTGRLIGYEFSIHWENIGNTPTTEIWSKADSRVFDKEEAIPAMVIDATRKPAQKIQIPPNATIQSSYIFIGIEDLIAVWKKEKRIVAFFQLCYRDIFPNTPLRELVLAFELKVPVNPTLPFQKDGGPVQYLLLVNQIYAT